jgi:hypothetical protein
MEPSFEIERLKAVAALHQNALRKLAEERESFAEACSRPGSASSFSAIVGWSKPNQRRVSLFAEEPRPTREMIIPQSNLPKLALTAIQPIIPSIVMISVQPDAITQCENVAAMADLQTPLIQTSASEVVQDFMITNLVIAGPEMIPISHTVHSLPTSDSIPLATALLFDGHVTMPIVDSALSKHVDLASSSENLEGVGFVEPLPQTSRATDADASLSLLDAANNDTDESERREAVRIVEGSLLSDLPVAIPIAVIADLVSSSENVEVVGIGEPMPQTSKTTDANVPRSLVDAAKDTHDIAGIIDDLEEEQPSISPDVIAAGGTRDDLDSVNITHSAPTFLSTEKESNDVIIMGHTSDASNTAEDSSLNSGVGCNVSLIGGDESSRNVQGAFFVVSEYATGGPEINDAISHQQTPSTCSAIQVLQPNLQNGEKTAASLFLSAEIVPPVTNVSEIIDISTTATVGPEIIEVTSLAPTIKEQPKCPGESASENFVDIGNRNDLSIIDRSVTPERNLQDVRINAHGETMNSVETGIEYKISDAGPSTISNTQFAATSLRRLRVAADWPSPPPLSMSLSRSTSRFTGISTVSLLAPPSTSFNSVCLGGTNTLVPAPPSAPRQSPMSPSPRLAPSAKVARSLMRQDGNAGASPRSAIGSPVRERLLPQRPSPMQFQSLQLPPVHGTDSMKLLSSRSSINPRSPRALLLIGGLGSLPRLKD